MKMCASLHLRDTDGPWHTLDSSEPLRTKMVVATSVKVREAPRSLIGADWQVSSFLWGQLVKIGRVGCLYHLLRNKHRESRKMKNREYVPSKEQDRNPASSNRNKWILNRTFKMPVIKMISEVKRTCVRKGRISTKIENIKVPNKSYS